MRTLFFFLSSITLLSVIISCQSEEEKQYQKYLAEETQVILTEEEFRTLKDNYTSDVIPIGDDRVINDDQVAGEKECTFLTFDDLVDLYKTGNKRKWLLNHDFDINYYPMIFSNRGFKYDKINRRHKFGYGKCHYANAIRKRRIGLVVSHRENMEVQYQTTSKENMLEIEKAILDEGGKREEDTYKSRNYTFKSIPIDIIEKSSSNNKRPYFQISFRSTFVNDPEEGWSPEKRKKIKEEEEKLKKLLNSKPN